MAGTIVVGVDGSDPSRKALHWAAAEARLRDAQLVAVHAWSYAPVMPSETLDPMLMTPDFNEALERDAKQFLENEVAELRKAEPSLQVEGRAVVGPAAAVLIEAGEGADLIVLGTRGHGGFAGLLLGSVSQQVAHHAPCPLVLVPHE
jgi:nucleotide-binding universal stress UspA family protein